AGFGEDGTGENAEAVGEKEGRVSAQKRGGNDEEGEGNTPAAFPGEHQDDRGGEDGAFVANEGTGGRGGKPPERGLRGGGTPDDAEGGECGQEHLQHVF